MQCSDTHSWPCVPRLHVCSYCHLACFWSNRNTCTFLCTENDGGLDTCAMITLLLIDKAVSDAAALVNFVKPEDTKPDTPEDEEDKLKRGLEVLEDLQNGFNGMSMVQQTSFLGALEAATGAN